MRKIQKTQIEDFLHLLSRAHEEIKKAISSGKKDTALDLLSQCQDSAIQIGETIENLEGENFATIPLLENYCEMLYQIYENIRSNQSINPNKSYKVLQKSLNAIKNSVKNEIKVQIEAVFLPYKASMWDSLESIWQAAAEDPDCDAYVIPIPYYDKNPDGSFKEMHYEGGLYPDYVPITNYQAYDFQERCPDMIFIHNPYDECNYVTSVHPFFYSKNLKQFTEKLVYVPYFVLDEIDPKNQSAVEGMKHFCTVPGVIYADKVIVQSEDMRQIYVNVLTEYAKGSQANRKYWEDKILGLGSPKIDKVLSTRKEDIEIPEEWRRVIEKVDGSFKKVIFYNTSVTALLEHEEQYLKKMEDVFKVFKEAKEEIALLWRPHPLMKATIESMRPELWGKYWKLVVEYQEEGWGIYDDTADLDRVIALCDGYYGDPSSVVKLCHNAGVLIIIQNLNINTKKEINKLIYSICGVQRPGIVFTAKVNNYLYFVSTDTNALFSIDLSTGKCDYKYSFKSEKIIGDFLGNAFVYDRYIIVCPFNFAHFHIWDIEENQEKIIEETKTGFHNSAYLPRMIVTGEKILFFPSISKDLYSLNINTWKIEKLFGIYQCFLNMNSNGYTIFSRDAGYIYNEKIYFSMSDQCYIAEYDIIKNDFKFYALNIEEQIVLADGIRECLYMLSDKGTIYEWNIETHKLDKKTDIVYDNYNLSKIQSTAKYQDILYFMSPNDKFGIEYDVVKHKGKIGDYNDLFEFGDTGNSEYHFSLQDTEDSLYFISEEYELLILDLEKKQYQNLKLQFDNEQLKMFWNLQKVKTQSDNNKGKEIYKTF